MMRPVLASAALAVALAACEGAPPEQGGVARTAAPIIGGSLDHDHPAVVALNLGGIGLCTGTVVAPRVILTAAHCVKFLDDMEAGFVDVYFGENTANPTGVVAGEQAIYHKRYNDGSVGVFDVAMILLAEDAPIAPIPLNEADLAETVPIGELVHSVGYGVDENENAGVRRHANLPLNFIRSRHIVIGSPGMTICNGDSGGPDFYTFDDGVERVVGVHSFGLVGCTAAATSMRVDAFLEEFFWPVLDAWDGPCKTDGVCVTEGCRSVDADCDPCGFEGTCVRECFYPDLDCPLGGLTGHLCADVYDCESRECMPALDDPRVTYCTDECDPGNAHPICGGALDCVLQADGRHVCVYPGPTPSAQGSRCVDGTDCRSGMCDDRQGICVEACDPGGTACPEPWTCQESALAPHVCRGIDDDTTRSFSSLCGAARGRGGGWGGAALLLAAALVARLTRGRSGGRRGGGSGAPARPPRR